MFSIEEGFVTAASKDGEEFEIKADTIIFAAGMKARTDEANTFFRNRAGHEYNRRCKSGRNGMECDGGRILY